MEVPNGFPHEKDEEVTSKCKHDGVVPPRIPRDILVNYLTLLLLCHLDILINSLVKSRELFGFNRNQHEKANNPLNTPPLEKKKVDIWASSLRKITQIYDVLGDILLSVSKKGVCICVAVWGF